uniref:Uncharacterized protein n=1 Tax=Oryza rufipogon TaxID=4529 RepID=A0A0E0PYD9_ORYRU
MRRWRGWRGHRRRSRGPPPSRTSRSRLRPCLATTRPWWCARRSRKEAEERPNRKSCKQCMDMYMRPFLLNVFFSKRFVHAKVVHRGTSECIIETGAWQRDGQQPEASAEGGDAGTVGRGRQRAGERRQSPSMPEGNSYFFPYYL